MKPILLDTHTAIWASEGRLGKNVTRLIDEAAGQSRLFLSPVSAWEIGMLAEKRKIALAGSAQEYIRALYSQSGAVVAPLTPDVALAAALLPRSLHADPADRFLVATAIAYGADFFTRDSEILRYAKSTPAFRAVKV